MQINYVINLESKLKFRFKVLKNEDKNSEKEFDSICPVESTPGILQGNPKVQKTVVNSNPKFRPILSAINISTHLSTKYLNSILSNSNEFTAKNSFDFVEEIFNYNHNHYIPLYTFIP